MNNILATGPAPLAPFADDDQNDRIRSHVMVTPVNLRALAAHLGNLETVGTLLGLSGSSISQSLRDNTCLKTTEIAAPPTPSLNLKPRQRRRRRRPRS